MSRVTVIIPAVPMTPGERVARRDEQPCRALGCPDGDAYPFKCTRPRGHEGAWYVAHGRLRDAVVALARWDAGP